MGVEDVLLNEQEEEEDGREDPLPLLDETRHDSDIGLTISHFSKLCRTFLSVEPEPEPEPGYLNPEGEDDTFDIGLTIAHVRRLGKALGG